MDNATFHPMLQESCSLFHPHRKGGKTRNCLASILSYDTFFEHQALALLPFSTAVIIGLFLVADLTKELDTIKELDLEVLLPDSFLRLQSPSTWKMKKKTNSKKIQ